MARWFRSEPMKYISLIVNEDAAHDCLADLGRMGVIQFTDVSSLLYIEHGMYVYTYTWMKSRTNYLAILFAVSVQHHWLLF